VCTTQERQDWGPVLVDDAKGGVIISWGETGNGGRVRAQRVDSSGNLRWGGIRDESWGDVLPREVSLGQNWPNPFNQGTAIGYRVSAINYQRSAVSLKIYNVLGKLVEILVVDERLKAGTYRITWDASKVASGVYFYRLEVNGDRLKVTKTRKMVVLR